MASVVVSVLHISKASITDHKRIDGRRVQRITAFLFHRGGHDNPARLLANAGKSFVGSIVLGMGFTFDDTDTKGVASPLAQMRRLVEQDVSNQEVIVPYIGGQEVNTHPKHAHHRYVINFRDWPLQRAGTADHPPDAPGKRRVAATAILGDALPAAENANATSQRPVDGGLPSPGSWRGATDPQRRAWLQGGTVPRDYPGPVAEDWPDALAIVVANVKPERLKLKRSQYRTRWWQFAEKQFALYNAISNMERVLVIPQTSNVQALAFLPTEMVFGHTLIVFPLPSTYGAFAMLQSRCHQTWSAFFGPTMKDDLRYTPSDCFETFPFPNDWQTDATLEAAGRKYYEFRAGLMARTDQGLTATYNRFHDPYEYHPDISMLRTLHATMDRAVLDAYGWFGIPTDCEFLLDYDINSNEPGKRKKPYRYRWPDTVRDEALARLL